MSASEKAYLDHLEKLIVSPELSPYVRRGPKQAVAEAPAAEPVYDSGPLMPDQVKGPRPDAGSSRQPSRQHRPVLATEDGKIRLGADGVYELEIEVPHSDLDEEDYAPQARQAPPRPQPRPQPQPQPRVQPRPQPQPQPRRSSVYDTVPGDTEPDPEPPREAPRRAPAPPSTPPHVMYAEGTLVRWDGNRLAIYKDFLESKGYDLIYVVEPGGRLVPKGVCLAPYEPERVGLLSQGILEWMESNMRWDRDALIYHFGDFADTRKVAVLHDAAPAANSNGASGSPNHNGANNGAFVRGQTFTIHMGRHQWQGVYWGRDQIGTLVAHDTNRAWSLMHLDLKRFGPGVQYGEVLSPDKLREIEAAITDTAQLS